MATKEILTLNYNISWTRIVDVLNEVFNCGYGGYQSASWFPNGRDGEKIAWFPKLSLNNEKPVAKEWDNYFFGTEKKLICQRRILTKEEDTKPCQGNKSHYNNPLDYSESVPPISPECQIADYKIKIHGRNWHSKEIAVFAKLNECYRFFGIYKFLGIQIKPFEKIIRNNRCIYTVKDKYIEVFERISEELKISEWKHTASNRR